MATRALKSALLEPQGTQSVSLALVSSLLDTLDKPLLLAERTGRLILATLQARQSLNEQGLLELDRVNLFSDLLRRDSKDIFAQIEMGQQEVELDLTRGDIIFESRILWQSETEWYIVHVTLTDGKHEHADASLQLT